MHAIVTGGAGFIGSNVSATFLRDGHRVTIFDCLARPGVERNLEWLEAQAPAGALRFVQGDVRDADLVRSVVGANDVHLVFHFAAQTAVTTSLVAPREDLERSTCRERTTCSKQCARAGRWFRQCSSSLPPTRSTALAPRLELLRAYGAQHQWRRYGRHRV